MSNQSASMSNDSEPLFEAFLNKHDDAAWRGVVTKLQPAIHEVDRNATQVWFAFYPLALLRALEQAEDVERLARRLQLQGKYYLKDQIDSSHTFLYGHRYWPQVKTAVADYAASAQPASLDLAAQIREVAESVAARLNVNKSLVTGIAAVAFMTLQQVGAAAFKAAPGKIGKVHNQSPDRLVQDRARDDRQSLFSMFKPTKEFTVTFDENDPKARFKIFNSQQLTTAAANDKRDYAQRDSRCVPGEGPIPVECRSASCGTCWVGILGGEEKLSEVGALERRRIRDFGYIDTDERSPLIRLACQAQAYGAVSIVIPPWNGVFGKHLRGYQSLLETMSSEIE
jgi:ferredoxin